MSEPGFEVAAAYISVLPNTSNFAADLDEQVGGLALSVVVTANAADFEASFLDQVGGLSLSVPVTASAADFEASLLDQVGSITVPVTMAPEAAGAADLGDLVNEQAGSVVLPVSLLPETGDFVAVLEERLGDLSVPVGVYPDADPAVFQGQLDEQVGTPVVGVNVQASLENMAEHLADSLAGAIPVPVVPDVSVFTDALDEELAGLTASVQVVPDTTDFAAALDEQVGAEQLTVPVSADTSGAVDALDGLVQAEDSAAAGASGLTGQYAALQEQLAAMGGELDYLTARFTALAPGTSAAAAETDAVSASLDSLNSQLAFVGGDLASFEGEMSAAGASAAGNAEQVGLFSSMLSELQGNLTAADDAISGWVASSSAARDAAGGTAGAVDMVAQSAAGLSEAAPEAADAAGGLSGVLDELAGRMSYFAVDPFMWMYAAPVVFEGVTVAAKTLSGGIDGLVTSLAAADNASGYNISGYQQLAGQLGQVSAGFEAESKSEQGAINVHGLASQAAHVLASESGALTAAQQQQLTAADNLTGHLGDLESVYGLTQQQAQALGQAAGVSGDALQGSGAKADAAMASIERYANANLDATGPVNQMAADMLTFGNDTLSVSSQVSALDDAYGRLVGNFVSTQQDRLQVQSDFLAVSANAQQAGASMSGTNAQSVILQESFYSTLGAVEQTAKAMHDEGATTQQLTGYIGQQITQLEGLTGGSATAKQAVSDLKQFEDNLTESTGNLYGQINRAADALASNFSKQLTQAGMDSQQAKTDVDNLTTSILNNGSGATSTQNDRAQLIADLEAAGVKASTAKTDVDNFITSIGKIPKQVQLSIIENATGTVSITQTAASAANQQAMASLLSPTGHASGGLVTGGSRHPRADDIPALLSHGEYVVSAGAVSKYGTSFLDSVNAQHFASGGYAGDLAGLAAWTGSQYTGLVDSLAGALEASLQSQMSAASAGAGRSPVTVIFNGTQMPTPEQEQALMTKLSALVGVS